MLSSGKDIWKYAVIPHIIQICRLFRHYFLLERMIVVVIISETYGLSGKKHYELEELETGQRTTWVPPLAMERSKHKDALIQVAKRLEASAQQSITAFSVAAIPMQEEATANTPFGVYATKVFIPRRAPKMAEKTLDGWKQYLRLRILPAFGNVAIGEITPGRLIM